MDHKSLRRRTEAGRQVVCPSPGSCWWPAGATLSPGPCCPSADQLLVLCSLPVATRTEDHGLMASDNMTGLSYSPEVRRLAPVPMG